jgi:arsenate reductase
MLIYHNPRCGKSRESLAFLKELGFNPEVKEYLKTPPSFDELSDIIQKLGISPIELIRQKEKLFIEQFKELQLTDKEWIRVMTENPVLIERPVILNEGKAVIGRPKENILKILS